MKLVALILVATLSYSFCSKIQINGYRSAIFMESRLWTGRVMPYKFDGTLSKRDERTIKHHIASFNKEMRGCLKIRPKIISDKLFVTVSGDKSTACWTEIGKNPIWRPMKIVFGKNCASRNGTVKHEFIHRFGRYHEHQRPDRDKYIKIVNSMSRQPNYGKCKDCVTHDVPYDFRSVMHYPGSDIKIKVSFFSEITFSSLKTFVFKGKHFDPKEMRSSHNLSRLDKLILRKMYKCPIPEVNFSEYSGYKQKQL